MPRWIGTPEDRLPARLASRAEVDEASGCWRWTGPHNNQGYGYMTLHRRKVLVHRVAYELFVGPIPAGHEVDHVAERGCVHRDCFYPGHLQPVTHAENCGRSTSIGRASKAQDVCGRGHPMSGDNLYVAPSGRRRCRACERVREGTRRR